DSKDAIDLEDLVHASLGMGSKKRKKAKCHIHKKKTIKWNQLLSQMAVVDRADEQADRRMNRQTGLSGWWKLLPFVSRKVPDETWKRSSSVIWTHSARLMKEDGRVDLPLLAIPTWYDV
ncbi:hypothetical protein FRB91_009420, partial [Serendipita sp. 411]